MRNKTSYEWVVEFYDEYKGDECRDIQDSEYFERFNDLYYNLPDGMVDFDDELIRYFGKNEEGEHDRGYAYIVNCQLPDEFDCGHKVPGRFKKQLQKEVVQKQPMVGDFGGCLTM